MKRLTLFALCVLWIAAAVSAQSSNDVLYLQDGRERVGELISISPEAIVFRVAGEAEPTSFARTDIQRLDLTRKRAGDDARTAAELDDPLLQRLLENQPSKFAYPDSGHVTLYRLHERTLGADGSYTLRERRVEKVLLERGKDRANVARYFKKGEESLEIDFARTINPDGTVTAISGAGVDITSANSRTPEYEKLYQVKFAMKQLKEGSVIDYQLTKHRPDTDLLNPFDASVFFRSDEPILETELCIHVPDHMNLAYQEDRLGSNVEFTREVEAGFVTYRWVAKKCPRVVPEPDMPPAGDLYPHVTAAVQTSWDDIAAEFAAALARANTPSAEIKAKVAELIAGVDDPEQRACDIYHYFIEAIDQQWVSPRSYGYEPHAVAEVFARRAGNSLDKAHLLSVMLAEAGLPTGVVLARPQGNGRLVEAVPCIRQFTDALVAVDLPGGRRFLPITSETVRFGQMPGHYQGTRGLLVSGAGGQLVDVPLNMPDDERLAVEYRVQLTPAGDLVVHKAETLTGHHEFNRRRAWKNQKDEELRRGFEVALTAMHPKARLDDYTIENLHDVTRPLKFTQTYTLVDYAMRAGDELLVFQLPEVDYRAGSVGKPTREFPLRWYNLTESTKDMTIEIPDGYRVYYAGKDYESDCGLVSFTATFSSAGDEIHYHDTFVRQELEAPSRAYGDYKQTIETQARVPKEWIVLERATD